MEDERGNNAVRIQWLQKLVLGQRSHMKVLLRRFS